MSSLSSAQERNPRSYRVQVLNDAGLVLAEHGPYIGDQHMRDMADQISAANPGSNIVMRKCRSSDAGDMERGFVRFVANIYSEAMGVNLQMVDTLSLETALQVLAFIKPEFPDCTFSVTRYACEMDELPALKNQQDRLNNVLGYVATCEHPGTALLRLIGYHQRATE